MITQNIMTDRLILIPVTLQLTTLLLSNDLAEIENVGIRMSEHWPTSDTKDILPIVHETLKRQGTPSGFEFWMIQCKENNTVIGDIGFHGKPDENGAVEVGFGLAREEWNKGYGYEALKGIAKWTMMQEGVKTLKADCLIDNIASRRILEKIGLKEVYRNDECIFWNSKIEDLLI